MSRVKTVTAINKKIVKVQNLIQKAKERYDNLCNELSSLMKGLDVAQVHELIAAVKNNNKSYSEVMTFLGKQIKFQTCRSRRQEL